MKKLLLILLLLPISGWGTNYGKVSCDDTIIISSLPYTMAISDTCYCLESDISTAGSGIAISAIHDFLLDMQGHEIIFDNNHTGSEYGLLITNAAYNGRITGGTIQCDTSQAVDTSYAGIKADDNCISWYNSHHITIDSMNLYPAGYNGHAVSLGSGTTVFYDNEYFGGKVISRCSTYYRRDWYDGAPFNMHIKDPLTMASDSVNFRIHDVDTIKTYAQGIAIDAFGYCWAKVEVYNNLVIGDARNYYYEWRLVVPGQEVPAHRNSSANPYGIHLSYIGPSKVYGNTIESGSKKGNRGILIENGVGLPDDQIEVHNNTLYCHEGPWGETGNAGIVGNMHAMRIRAIDDWYLGHNPTYEHQQYIWIYDNNITAICDTLTDTLTADTAAAYGLEVQGILLSMQYAEDSNIILENNTITAIALDSGTTECSALVLAEIESGTKNLIIRNNNYISDQEIVVFGSGSFTAYNATINGDTLQYGENPTSDTVSVYAGIGIIDGCIMKNCIYLNGADYKSIYNYAAAGISEVFVVRTLEMFARGVNDLPMVSAACTLWNAYGYKILDGTSDSGGMVTGDVNYYYMSDDVTDSTAYNDFIYHAWYDGELAHDSAFTVGPTASGATDTVDFATKNGTGIWGAGGEEPPEEPAKYLLKGAKLKGVRIK